MTRKQITDYVTSLYKKYLHRDPDASGLAHYVLSVMSGKRDLADVEESIACSVEAHNLRSDIRNSINDLYKKHLKREADKEGIDTYSMQVYGHYMTVGGVESDILQSAEYASLQHDAAVKPANPTTEMPAGYPLRSVFLADYNRHAGRALWTPMGILSYKKDEAYVRDVCNRLVGLCANSIDVYMVNQSDYAEQDIPVICRTDEDARVMRERLTMCRHFGLEPTAWMMCDDLPFTYFNRLSFEQVTTYWDYVISRVLEPLKIKRLVLGLEALEYWSEDLADRLGDWLKKRCPWALICWHTEPETKRMLDRQWIDIIYWQTKFWGKPEKLQGEIASLRDEFKKPVVAAEYSMEGLTEEAQALGNAALAAGAWGALNGFGSGGPKSEYQEMLNTPLPAGKWFVSADSQLRSMAKYVGPVANLAKFSETINLWSVSFGGTQMHLDYSKDGEWEEADIGGGMSIGNIWLFQVKGEKVLATTIDYIRPGQKSKAMASLYNALDQGSGKDRITLEKGGVYGIMVSTLARNAFRTTDECSNIIRFTI